MLSTTPASLHANTRRHQGLEVLGPDVIIDPDIPGPIYGNPNVPGKDQIGRSGPSYSFRAKPVLKDGPEGPGPGKRTWLTNNAYALGNGDGQSCGALSDPTGCKLFVPSPPLRHYTPAPPPSLLPCHPPFLCR